VRDDRLARRRGGCLRCHGYRSQRQLTRIGFRREALALRSEDLSLEPLDLMLQSIDLLL
jgi:hypothetical protein